MNYKKILISAFVLLALIQLFVPAKMIWDRENVIDKGTEYKFRTAPVDPSDPFRGKYITLNFKDDTFIVDDKADWSRGEPVYVYFATNKDGFAQIKAVTKEHLTDDVEYIRTKVRYITRDSTNTICVDYPFDRYYMEETKAYDAEHAYIQSQADTASVTYAIVRVKNGDAVLQDVLINEIPIKDLVEKKR
ncbi:MAG: GDYXXLXY domain-containing protein [Bacteroidales bacterium]|nr:GDYXXLXY domain-containing protein [Bacteroidales bacterium]